MADSKFSFVIDDPLAVAPAPQSEPGTNGSGGQESPPKKTGSKRTQTSRSAKPTSGAPAPTPAEGEAADPAPSEGRRADASPSEVGAAATDAIPDLANPMLKAQGWRVYSHLAYRVRELADQTGDSAQQVVNALLDKALREIEGDAKELMSNWRAERPRDKRRL